MVGQMPKKPRRRLQNSSGAKEWCLGYLLSEDIVFQEFDRSTILHNAALSVTFKWQTLPDIYSLPLYTME